MSTPAGLARRLAALEETLREVAATGCDRCAAWPDQVMVYDGDDGDPDGGWPGEGVPEHPRPWPDDFRCPDCGRGPEVVIRVTYGDDDPRMQQLPPAPATAPATPGTPPPTEYAPVPALTPPPATSPEAVLAELHELQATLAALKATVAPEPEPEPAPAAVSESPAARPLRGWGPTHRRTTARPSAPLRYGWR